MLAIKRVLLRFLITIGVTRKRADHRLQIPRSVPCHRRVMLSRHLSHRLNVLRLQRVHPLHVLRSKLRRLQLRIALSLLPLEGGLIRLILSVRHIELVLLILLILITLVLHQLAPELG
jgi:hypothetical protein